VVAEFRWGIVGSGRIAASMVGALRELDDADVVAVASPTPGRAEQFAGQFDISRFHTDPRELAGTVDVAYVASANHRHPGDVSALIGAGVPVLCEKPVAIDSQTALAMREEARAAGVFFMEAMWMVFQPFWPILVDLVSDGAVGELSSIDATFNFTADRSDRRLFDPAMGGGALLDIGIYPVSLVHAFAGVPTEISASAEIGASGVDEQVAAVMRHAGGVQSVVSASLRSDRHIAAQIGGTEGSVTLADPFHASPRVTLRRRGATVAEYDTSGTGLKFEAAEVHRCLEAGLVESDARPHAHTIAVLRILDRIRAEAVGSPIA